MVDVHPVYERVIRQSIGNPWVLVHLPPGVHPDHVLQINGRGQLRLCVKERGRGQWRKNRQAAYLQDSVVDERPPGGPHSLCLRLLGRALGGRLRTG